MFYFVQSFDWSVLHGIRNAIVCPALDFLMPKITALGNGGAIWIAAGIALLFFKKYRRYGIALLLALCCGALVGNVCLKPLVGRARPCWIEDVPLLIAMPRDYSFPSGHTLSSVIGTYVLCAADRKFTWIAVPLAALIAFSRLYLFVHFPTDVLAAVVLGLLIGAIAVAVCRRTKKE